MRDCLFRKGLVVGIIILFISVSVLSSVSSKDISVSDEKMLEYDSELEDNKQVPIWDEYDEIISRIAGEGQISGDGLPPFIFFNLILDEGEFDIKAITKNPSNRFYTATANKINVGLFIGILVGANPPVTWTDYIIGYAIGNIEWE